MLGDLLTEDSVILKKELKCKAMRILAINGSPHKDGNTFKLINEIFQGARQLNYQCEIVHLIDLNLGYCNWCGDCYTTGVCPIDDGFQEHLEQIFEADVL
ncbi:MAG: flavodoxin family protein, partial [Candidatus Heimdallarchaeota archaeon]